MTRIIIDDSHTRIAIRLFGMKRAADPADRGIDFHDVYLFHTPPQRSCRFISRPSTDDQN